MLFASCAKAKGEQTSTQTSSGKNTFFPLGPSSFFCPLLRAIESPLALLHLVSRALRAPLVSANGELVNQVALHGITQPRPLRHLNRSIRSHFDGGLDDIFIPISPACRNIA